MPRPPQAIKPRRAILARYKDGTHTIKIQFPYDPHDIALVKEIPGRKWHPDHKIWTCPPNKKSLDLLSVAAFEIGPKLREYINTLGTNIKTIEIPGLKKNLFEYQKAGVAFVESVGGRALIGDDMGLGKTVQAIAYLQLKKFLRPTIIVCPASVKQNWARECGAWLGMGDNQVEILSGTQPWFPSGDILIINYDILDPWVDTLLALKPACLIVDECFPAGILIETPTGFKRIENIQEGDIVYNATGIGIVQKAISREVEELVEVYLDHNTFFECTPNHPFFTDNGWIPAKDLEGRMIFEKSDILHILAKTNTQRNGKRRKKVRVVWEHLQKHNKQKKILRELLCSEMEDVTTENTRKDQPKTHSRTAFNDSQENARGQSSRGSTNSTTDERKQSFDKSGSNVKNQKILGETWAPPIQNERREWPGSHQSTTSTMEGVGITMDSGICNSHRKGTRFRLSNFIQSRFGKSKTQNMDRIGWLETQFIRTTRKRQEKRSSLGRIKVERVEISKPPSGARTRKSTVYNLQVSGHPSYYADGFLVHNCQYVKNGKTKRTKAARTLSKNIRHLIALSGTPIVNRPVEFFNVIQMINRELFPNWMEYTRKYCARKHNGFGWDVSGASNTQELHEILSGSVMIRRTKQEVLTELPDKIRSFFPMEMHPDLQAEYHEAERNFLEWMETRRGKAAAERASYAETLSQIEVFKQVAVAAKMPHAIEWIQDFLDTGEKLVVFATHHKVIDILMKQFEKVAVKVDGRDPGLIRQNRIDSFQNDPDTKLFIGNIKAAGVGITLTAASNVAFLEYPWTSGEILQAEDRCHRIGQKSAVNIYYLFAEGTIEEQIIQLLDRKAKILNQILDGASTEEQSVFAEFMDNYLS